ncbi:MAG: TetR/AcrR family transcriptional regulator [Chloroflexi bacterium]|nr:TetR/AcrR family transcriptional regulator [Chloroflexota bacterium]
MVSKAVRVDPRITRTLNLLGDALRDLIVERGYDSITVQDITDRADVSRTTFYLHFKDKDELLFASMRRIYDELTSTYKNRLQDMRSLAELEEFACNPADYEHVAQYADFYRAMLGKHGSAAFIQQVMNYLTNEFIHGIIEPAGGSAPQTSVPVEIIAAFLAGAEIGVINWWLQNDMRYSPAEMARMQYRLAIGGLQGVLGMMNGSGPTEPSGEENHERT